MTRNELDRIYRRSMGELGTRCPRCGSRYTEEAPRESGRWTCWRCGAWFAPTWGAYALKAGARETA